MAHQIVSCRQRNSKSRGQAIPARSIPTTTAFRRTYFQAMKRPVQVDITSARAVAAKNIFIGSGPGAGEVGGGEGDFEAIELRRIGFWLVHPYRRGRRCFSQRKVQCSFLMQLRKVNENGGRNIRTPAARFVQPEHLKATRDSEKEDRWGKKHTNVMMCEACRFEVSHGCHFGYRFHENTQCREG